MYSMILLFSEPAICAVSQNVAEECPSNERCISTEKIGKCLSLYSLFSRHDTQSVSSKHKKDAELFARLLLFDLKAQEEAIKVSKKYMDDLLSEIESIKEEDIGDFLVQADKKCVVVKIEALKLFSDALKLHREKMQND